MQTLSQGVYVIGVADNGRTNAFTAASIMPVSFQPALIALAIGRDHASYPLLRAARGFTVNVLRHDQMALARHFGTTSGKQVDKLAGIRWRAAASGAPILVDALAHLDCELQGSMQTGDHELVVGRVIGGTILSVDAAPLVYAETGDMDGAESRYAPIANPGALPV